MSHYENVNVLAADGDGAEPKVEEKEEDKLVESVYLAPCYETIHYEKVNALAANDGETKPKIEKMERDKLVESVCLVHCASDKIKTIWDNISILTTKDGAADTKDKEMKQNEKNYCICPRYHRKYSKYAFIAIGVIVAVVFIAFLAMLFKKDSITPDTKSIYSLTGFRGKLVVLTTESELLTFDPKTKNSTIIFDTIRPSAAGFDMHTDQRIYWTEWVDFPSRSQLKALVNESPSVLIDDKRFRPRATVLDHVSENLYVADVTSGKLVVVSVRTGKYALLMSNLGSPNDIVLDPEEGLMFILDLDRNSIIRARMDGTEMNIVVNTNTTSLTLDPKRKRLYWIKDFKDIESSNYDGNSHQSFFKSPAYVNNIAIVDDRLYWFRVYYVDPSTLFSCEIGTSRTCEKHTNYTTTIFGIPEYVRGYSSTHGTSVKSPCEDDNGGCQQLCLQTGRNSRSCICRMGWQMNPDKRSCHEVRDFLIYLQDGYVRVKSIDGATKDLVWPTPYEVDSIAIKGEIDFDYDLINDDFYWSDDMHIYKMKLKKFDEQLAILSINEPNTTLQDVAYDWYTGNMYFVQRVADRLSSHHSLMMFNVNLGETHRKTLMTYYYVGETCPYALSLHPAEHSMFFACKGVIQHATMNNTDIGKIYTNFPDFKRKYRLVAVDYTKDRIYWIWYSDLVTIIKHSNFDGSDVKVISVNSVKNGQTIDVHDRWLYIGNSTSIWRVDKETGRGAVQIASNVENDQRVLAGFKVISEKVHVSGDDNNCAEGNGGCEQFCLNGKDGPVCMCMDYMVARGFTCSRV